MKHYEVYSPEWRDDSTWDFGPPEYNRGWALVLANNKKEAIKLSIKEADMKDWVEYARMDAMNPFVGLKAELAECEHGVCWACNSTEESSGCPLCDELSRGNTESEMARSAESDTAKL